MSVCTFQDAESREWHPRLTAGVIRRISEQTGITIAQLQSLDVKLADIMAALWHSVEREARERKMSREDFEDSMGLAEIRQAVAALQVEFIRAFPEFSQINKPASREDAEGKGEDPDPFGLGK